MKMSNNDLNELNGYIINNEGTRLDMPWNQITEYMDDDLAEAIHMDNGDELTNQEFFEEYAKRHEEKFGETWELDKANPVI